MCKVTFAASFVIRVGNCSEDGFIVVEVVKGTEELSVQDEQGTEQQRPNLIHIIMNLMPS